MALVIRRLEEHDEVENFDCGDDALNNYLNAMPGPISRRARSVSAMWLLDEDAPRTVLGYFTLAMAACLAMLFRRSMSAVCLLTICP